MPKIYLGLGSNIERQRHLGNALDRLCELFGDLLLSSVYESPAMGFAGDPFYNLVVGFETEVPLAELLLRIKTIEDENQRDRGGPKFGPRTLDIDVLSYGDLVGRHQGIELPRPEILEHAYVLLPLVEVAGSDSLPGTLRSYQSLWLALDKNSQPLWRVDFVWRERLISQAEPSSDFALERGEPN